MKKLSLFLAASILLLTVGASTAQADWHFKKDDLYRGKNPIRGVEQTTTDASYCFDAGFDFSMFAAGIWPEARTKNGVGGGIGISYFFDRNIGVEMSYAAYGQGTAEQVYGARLIYRWPLDGGGFSGDWAPYVFGGGGGVSMGTNNGYYEAGGGIDVRLESWGCIGFFGEFSYNFVDASISDFTQVRVGMRLPF